MARLKLEIKNVYSLKRFPNRVIRTHTGQGRYTATRDPAPRLAINDKPLEAQESACLTYGMLPGDPHMASPSQRWSSLRRRAVTPSGQANAPLWKCLPFKGFAISWKHRQEIRERESLPLSKVALVVKWIACFRKPSFPSLNIYPFRYLTYT